MFCLLAFLPLSFSQTLFPPISLPKKTINVGIAMVEQVQEYNIGWSVCGGALSLALDYLRAQNYLLDVDFNFYFNYTECDPARAVAVGIDFIRNKNVDAIIGPPCPGSAYMMGILTTYYKTYMISWGYVSDAAFGKLNVFPYLTTMMPSSATLAYAALKVLERFKWDRYSFLYTDDDVNYCRSIFSAVQSAMLTNGTYFTTMVYYAELPRGNPAAYGSILGAAKNRSRIMMVCFNSPSEVREFMYRASDHEMATDEFVFLVLSMMSTGFGQNGDGPIKLANGLTPFWIDSLNDNLDKKDAAAKEGAKRALVLDLSSKTLDTAWLSKFNEEVLARVRDSPSFCSTPECINNGDKQPGGFSRQLHDAMYLYGISLSSAIKLDPVGGHRNPDLLQEGVQIQVNGLSGEISMNANSSRDPYYVLYYLDEKGEENTFMNVTVLDNIADGDDLFDNEYTTIWATRGGNRPLSRPICGFSGLECPLSFMETSFVYIVVGTSVAILMIAVGLLVIAFSIRSKRNYIKIQRAVCLIPSFQLSNPLSKARRNSNRSITPNMRSLSSSADGSHGIANAFEVYNYEKEPVMVSVHEYINLSENDFKHFFKIRKLDHPNLNQFIGISIDSRELKVVWRYCSRSSLYNIIAEGHMSTMDAFFIYCVVKDIAEGLAFLHQSFLHCHGRLNSGCCLVNEGWQVKISDYGTLALKPPKKYRDIGQLWTAPELLRQPGFPSPAGDIYSFAIIASEVINRSSPFNYKERIEGLDELIFLIKKGGMRPIRPQFDTSEVDISSTMLSLVRDCWSESPSDRPTAEEVLKTIISLMPNDNTNLIDHVFAKMEQYTATLEMEVEDRTKELAAEKKKADILLSRMLPKQVAEKLKKGQTVEPEHFDSVSVLFMDIVKFTQLSAKCSPLQVISILNEIFSNFDGIIEIHDAYKVESIGDGYLCVSGLPTRNGFRHIREIVEMALAIMNYVKEFRIAHLPRERVELRVGVNSGPCVAGVVGLAMPRYCLFGDTVNTASRMESNGKASMIHLSGAAHTLLIQQFGNEYKTESRGDVIIKGKGVMETFWVLGRMAENTTIRHVQKTPPLPPLPGEIVENEESGESEAMYRKFTRQATQQIQDDRSEVRIHIDPAP